MLVKLAPQRVEQSAHRINQIAKEGVDERLFIFCLSEIAGCILPVVRCADILSGNTIFPLLETGIAGKIRGDLLGYFDTEALSDVQAGDLTLQG